MDRKHQLVCHPTGAAGAAPDGSAQRPGGQPAEASRGLVSGECLNNALGQDEANLIDYRGDLDRLLAPACASSPLVITGISNGVPHREIEWVP
jgi:hypothetical protein